MAFFRKLPKPPTEVYPLVGAVGIGCGLSVYCLSWNLRNNTDVNLSKSGYSWENIDPATHNPHLPFMAGAKANQKIKEYKQSNPKVVENAHFTTTRYTLKYDE